MYFWIFTVIYYSVFLHILHLIFRNTLSVETDILAIICMVITLFISVGLAEFTEKKIKENKKKP